MVQSGINKNISTKLVNKNIKIGKAKMDFSAELDKMITTLKDRVSKEVPDTGYFRNFAVNLEKGKKPDFFAKNIAIFVEKDEERDGRAYLGVSVLHPTMDLMSYAYLMNGDRDKILNFIDKEDFKPEIESAFLKLAEGLKNK